MKSLKTMTGDSLEDLIDYNVVDQNGDHIGSLHSLWSDPSTGSVEFLGVKTGWLFGHNHVVPADKAEFDEASNAIHLPYTEAFIREAPSMSADAEISEAEEENIYRYYGLARAGAPVSDPLSDQSGYETVLEGITSAPRLRKVARPGETWSEDANPDPLTGAPGAHPVGTGVGAAGGGAAGAAIGATVGGPVGAVIGGVAGAVSGGLVGKGVAETVDPTAENTYWESNYQNAPYYEAGREYADYAPAYRVGYEGYSRHGAAGRDYMDVEPDLEREYMNARGSSEMGWEKAKAATRDAWERLKSKTSHTVKSGD
jgi:sporulation protein YlmC with PRC-barrel domain